MEPSSSIVLHGMKTGNCIRAAMALEEAAMRYVVRRYDPRTPGTAEVEYRKLNPTGKVPTLVDRSQPGEPFVLTQSNAIVLYAAYRAPGKLLPGDERAQTRVLERFFYFVTDVIAPSHAGFYLRTKEIPAAAKQLADRSTAAIEDAERFASASMFIAGESFSIADIAAVTIIASVADELPWDRLPALSRWFAEVRNRPTFGLAASAFDG
jgi:GST-like protein